jgi:diacylglycerol kinase (ATP)
MPSFFKSRFNSFGFALEGFIYVIKTQKNAWIHALMTVIVIFLGVHFAISAQNWAIIFLTIGLVWMAELFNTAIETIIDLISPQQHPLAKIVKDLSAAAVLITAISAVLIGLFIFGPMVLQLFLFR